MEDTKQTEIKMNDLYLFVVLCFKSQENILYFGT